VNGSGPLCRRCKADLGLLFMLEHQQREEAKRLAVAAAIDGDFAEALAAYRNATHAALE
jgi:hypothetical protein